MPLVACCLEEPPCQEHAGDGDCIPEFTIPSMHQRPLHLYHVGSKRLSQVPNGQLPPCLCRTATDSTPNGVS